MTEEYNEEDVADYQEDDVGEDYDETGDAGEDLQPEEMEKRVQEMEAELDQLTKMQNQVEKQLVSSNDKIDENSIYVGQVDYEATPEELRAHFAQCGNINRVTIICDKVTGQSKGFAYVEFVDKESVDNALKLDDTLFKGRQLKVLPKRQNVPAGAMRGGRGRGRFGGRGGRGFAGRAPYYRGGGRGFSRGGGGRFGGRGRGRGAPAYHNSYY